MPDVVWSDVLVVKPSPDSLWRVRLLVRKSNHFIPRYSCVVQGVRGDGDYTNWVSVEGEIDTETGEIHSTLDEIRRMAAEAKEWISTDKAADAATRENFRVAARELDQSPRPMQSNTSAGYDRPKHGVRKQAIQRVSKTARDKARKMERRKSGNAKELLD